MNFSGKFVVNENRPLRYVTGTNNLRQQVLFLQDQVSSIKLGLNHNTALATVYDTSKR